MDLDPRPVTHAPDLAADLLAELGPTAPDADLHTQTLPRITDLARRTVVVVAAASVTLVGTGRPRTVAPSGPLATWLDEQQYRMRTAPCTDAARSGQQLLVHHRDDRTYPDFSAAARSAGVSHTLSIGLALPGPPASLNLYVCTAGRIPTGVLDRADQLAGYAALALGGTADRGAAPTRGEQLRSGLQALGVVESARGIVMHQRGMGPDAALQLLVHDADHQRVPLRVLAQRVVDRVLTY